MKSMANVTAPLSHLFVAFVIKDNKSLMISLLSRAPLGIWISIRRALGPLFIVVLSCPAAIPHDSVCRHGVAFVARGRRGSQSIVDKLHRRMARPD